MHVSAFTLSPAATMDECKSLAETLWQKGYTSAIMDCMGYSVALGDTVQRVGLDVYLAKGITIDALIAP